MEADDEAPYYPPTADIPEEIDRFGRATYGTHEWSPNRASVPTFPDLVVSPPLVLGHTDGYYTLTLCDPGSGEALTKFVRRDWAYEQRLKALGVTAARLMLNRHRVFGYPVPLFHDAQDREP
jgi:hypothetical protein